MAVTYDDYVIDVLMRDLIAHDRMPNAYIVYLYLWRETRAREVEEAPLSHSQIASATGLSKSGVQRAIAWLIKRKLIASDKATVTATPVYRVASPWRRGGLS